MAFDFLGTFSRVQYNDFFGFTNASRALISEGRDSTSGPINLDSSGRSPYIKHLQAEQTRANLQLAELEKANTCFANFSGDYPFQKDQLDYKQRVTYALSDSDTSVLIYDLKDFQRRIIKRKKENIEYRIKKMRDYEDQVEKQLITYSGLIEEVTRLDARVTNQFIDRNHANLSEDAMYDEFGRLTGHSPTKHLIVTNSRSDAPKMFISEKPPSVTRSNRFFGT